MMKTNEKPSPEEIEALLPWHAAGTLGSREADAVEQALAENGELARRFALVREEMTETILLNEALGVPSPRAMETLFAAIDNERKSVRSPLGRGLGAWLAALFTPRLLGFSAAAAALIIALQAGIIAKMVLENGSDGEATFETASAPAARDPGSYVLVRFAPQANFADVTRLLDSRNAAIVDGPRPPGPGAMYRVQIAPTRLAADEFDRAVKEFQSAAGNLVSFVAPTE